MNIEIDQSGKIENTNKNTVIAFSDDIFGSILIKAKDKKEIQKIFRKIGRSRIFVYKLFAVLIFVLIKKYLKKIDQITIDDEYPGWDFQIKDYLLIQIKKSKLNFNKNDINFKRIGRKSMAHILAYETAIGKRKPTIKVEEKDILKFLLK